MSKKLVKKDLPEKKGKNKSLQIPKKKQLKEESDSEDDNANVNANIFNTKLIIQNNSDVSFCSDSNDENVIGDVGFFKTLEKPKLIEEKKLEKCCDFDSQVAYVAYSSGFKYDEENDDIILIGDYLKDKKLQKEINKSRYLICENGKELIKCEPNGKKPHFKHKVDTLNNEMSEWHKNWQSQFDVTEKHIGNRWADAVCGKYVLEFQHSKISKKLVDIRTKNYNDNGYEVLWIVDGNNGKVFVENFSSGLLIKFNADWIFESFINCNHVYLDYEDKILEINSKYVKGNYLVIHNQKTMCEFLREIEEQIMKSEQICEYTGKIYQRQMGAGCGKTYDSVRLIEKSEFNEKNCFIYLTKLSSAVNVIREKFDEFKNKLNEKSTIYDFNEIPVNEWTKNKETNKYEKRVSNKKFLFTCKRKCDINNFTELTILIGTVDSFAVSCVENINKSSLDMFSDVVRSISRGKIKNNITFRNYKLSLKTLVVIDESQDLDRTYFDAFWKILHVTNCDVYLIGDKLQSIMSSINIFTHIEANLEKLKENIIRNRNDDKNIVGRFHNSSFKDFVNGIVNFENHGLIKIQGTCTRNDCGHVHNNNPNAVKIFQMPTIYANDYEKDKVTKCVDKIIQHMDNEILQNKYLPQDFMIIFPILSKNLLASRLCEKIKDYWNEKVYDERYSKILETDIFWKKHMFTSKPYVFLHKSEDGQPIDLNESKNSTQIISIHSAKGGGRKCTFVLGLTDYSLKVFSTEVSTSTCPNIIYDSLVHVAITRHMEKLYVGLVNDNGHIWKKFDDMKNVNKLWKIDVDKTIKPSRVQSFKIKYDKVIDYFVRNDHKYEKLYNDVILQEKIPDKFNFFEEQNVLIGMEHHIIRQKVLEYYFSYSVYKNEKNNKEEQFIKNLKDLSTKIPQQLIHNEYFRCLDEIHSNSKKNEFSKNKIIPILKYAKVNKANYGKYADILQSYIVNIQNKIKKDVIPELCPVECIVYAFMCEIMSSSVFADITITDIYNVLYYYDEYTVIYGLDENHNNKYKCECINHFIKNNNCVNNDVSRSALQIGKTIVDHYNLINNVFGLHAKYYKKISEYVDNEKINFYNTKKSFCLQQSDDFNIHKQFKFLGSTNNYTIYFVLRHKITQMNINEILINLIFDNFLLTNHVEKNDNKNYEDKKVVTCIISLEIENPIFIDFDNIKYFDYMLKGIQEYLTNFYDEINKQFIDRYVWSIEKTDGQNKLESSFRKLFADISNSDEFNNLPKYILEYISLVYDGYLFDKDEDDIFSDDEFDNKNDNKKIKDLEILKPVKLLENLNKISRKRIKENLIQKRKQSKARQEKMKLMVKQNGDLEYEKPKKSKIMNQQKEISFDKVNDNFNSELKFDGDEKKTYKQTVLKNVTDSDSEDESFEKILKKYNNKCDNIQFPFDTSEIKKYIDKCFNISCEMQTQILYKNNGDFYKCLLLIYRTEDKHLSKIPVVVDVEKFRIKYDPLVNDILKFVKKQICNRTNTIYFNDSDEKVKCILEKINNYCKNEITKKIDLKTDYI